MGEKDSTGAGRGQPGRGGGAAAARKRFSGRAAGNRSTTNDANGANGEGGGGRDVLPQRAQRYAKNEPRKIGATTDFTDFTDGDWPPFCRAKRFRRRDFAVAARVARAAPRTPPPAASAGRVTPLLWIPCVQMIRAIGVIRGGFIRAIRVIRSRHRRSVIPTVNCEP